MTETSTVLRASGLVKRFGRVTAVDDVSFELGKGEVLTLLGPSGCGKTTTLRMVAGFERPDAGEIEIQGRVVVSTSRRVHIPPEKRGLGMVFQSYAIWPHMTVAENVGYPLKVRHVSKREIDERVEQTLAVVGLGGLGTRPALLLSGGQQQRVALARALVYSPSILLLDEPLSNLDAKLRGQMRIELKRLQQRLSVTVLFVTHDQIEAMSLSTRLAVMNQGRIEQIGSPRDLYEHPSTPFAEDFLGRVLRLHGTVVERSWSGVLVEVSGAGPRLAAEAADDSVAVGDEVMVGIRPEDLSVDPDGASTPQNTLRCPVEEVLYLGGECELVVRVGDGTHTLLVPRSFGAQVGQSVLIHLPPENLRVWAADPAPGLDHRSAAELTVAGQETA
ncbi:MAG: transporter ATP-binding protein [Chloroflexi bacterium]|nr:transporter ATP-binding protein [Chloroflexota bacterium]